MWYERGHRKTFKASVSRSYWYVLSAVSPETGDLFSLLMPWLDTEAFQRFLDDFAKHARCGVEKNREVWLAVDKAGWHVAKKLRIPAGLRVIPMPTGAAQINPVERLWLYVRDHYTRCRVVTGLKDLADVLSKGLNEIADSPETVKSVCAVTPFKLAA